jgi:hypothetical protein
MFEKIISNVLLITVLRDVHEHVRMLDGTNPIIYKVSYKEGLGPKDSTEHKKRRRKTKFLFQNTKSALFFP